MPFRVQLNSQVSFYRPSDLSLTTIRCLLGELIVLLQTKQQAGVQLGLLFVCWQLLNSHSLRVTTIINLFSLPLHAVSSKGVEDINSANKNIGGFWRQNSCMEKYQTEILIYQISQNVTDGYLRYFAEYLQHRSGSDWANRQMDWRVVDKHDIIRIHVLTGITSFIRSQQVISHQ